MGEKAAWIRVTLVIVSVLVITGGFFTWYKLTEPPQQTTRFTGFGIIHKKGYYTPNKCVAFARAVDPDMVATDPQQRMVYSIDGDNKQAHYDQKQDCVVLRRPMYPDGTGNNDSATLTIIGNDKWNNTDSTKKITIPMTIRFVGGVDESDQFFKNESISFFKNTTLKQTIFTLEPIKADEIKSVKFEIAEFAEDYVKKLVEIKDNVKIIFIGKANEVKESKFVLPIAIVDGETKEQRVRNLNVELVN